jgi:hypothetical protein
MRRCGIFVYRNAVRDRNWIAASNSSGLLFFFFYLFKFPGQSSSPATQNRVVKCVTAVSRPRCPSARSRWSVSTAIDNYRPTLTGSLPLVGGSTASLSFTAVDTLLLFTSLFISLIFVLFFVSTFLGPGARRSAVG